MIVLDTNIVIAYLKGDSSVADWLEARLTRGVSLAVSTMTVVELLSFPHISLEEQFLIERLLTSVLIVDVDNSIAREAARIRRTLKLKTVDSVIAATAVVLQASLITRDVAFGKIRDVKIIVP